MLSEKTIKEFQDIFEKKYGKRLSKEEAIESANNLLRFFELLYKIDCKNKQSKTEKENDELVKKLFNITSQ